MWTWHALELGDLLTAQATLDRLRETLLSTAPGEPGAAIFTRRTSGDVHCEVTAYFSPGAAALARAFGATPCAPPGRRGLELLAGPESNWAELG